LLVTCFFILLQISPYYLDYYNELVSGTNGVYKHKLFFLGEWGQGLRNPGMYYVIVNTFNVLRLGFDESILQKDYIIVYEEKADKAVLARVYKHKLTSL
jgi:hypothetical protein